MHIINLTIKCKTATGDGTKIVCMNTDYVVRINTEDCGTFTTAPVKKLVVRHGREYSESTIESVPVDGQVVWQASLPPVEHTDWVDIGVVGKSSDEPNAIPTYSSTSARFGCDKSILCGTAVLKADPKLSVLTITENGIHSAVDHGVDGFYQVSAQVAQKPTESVAVDLNLAQGNQEVTPSSDAVHLAKVTIRKPLHLIPENIRKNVTIAGVTGTLASGGSGQRLITENGEYDITEYASVKVAVAGETPRLYHEKFTKNGSYQPAAGYSGFSSVEVNVQPKLEEGNFTGPGTFYPSGNNVGFSKVNIVIPDTIPQYDGTIIIVDDTITFTITNPATETTKTYIARTGMTWGQWCDDSTYNTDGFYYGEEYTHIYGTIDGVPYVIAHGVDGVMCDEVIQSNAAYHYDMGDVYED